jgi:hypothetical protein
MSKKQLFAVVVALFFASIGVAQTSLGFKYQSVMRDADGNPLVEQFIGLKISVFDQLIDGTEYYSEEYNISTNSFGLINVNVGSQNPELFALIDWSNGPYYLRIYVDSNGGADYVEMGTSELMYVPYAIFANVADSVNLSGNEIVFEDWDKNVNDDFDGEWSSLNNTPISLSGYGITDAMSTSHDANAISNTDITNWNNSFSWGNHSTQNYLQTTGGTMTGDLGANGTASISGFNANLINSTSSSYTLSHADNGKVINLENSSNVSLIIPAGLSDGFNCLIVQKGAGQIVFSAGSGVFIHNRQNYDRTAGQYAIATLVNIGGDVYVVSGDMQ